MFNFISYIKDLTAQNRLTREKAFIHTTCSGLGYLEGMLQQYQTAANIICTSDVCSESTFQQSGGWFKRRVYTIFILMRYDFGDMTDYADKINTCREILRQYQSRILHDSEALATQLLYIHTDDMRANELGSTFLNGCTGLYFMLSMDEPTTLEYNPDAWETDSPSSFVRETR